MTYFPGNTWGGSVQEWFWVDGYLRGAVRGRASCAAQGMLPENTQLGIFPGVQ